jgi:alpha-tubulin suppressor-like RCC1 family protein
MSIRGATKLGVLGFLWAAMAFGIVGCAGGTGSAEDEPELARNSQPIIFGDDDRTELFALAPGSLSAHVAESSLALVDAAVLDTSDPANVKLRAPTLRARFQVCSDERFAAQPSAADCSGTLIAPDLLLTAGHCVDVGSCPGSARVLAGFSMRNATELQPIVSDQVYACAEVVVREFTSEVDYAIVRLDRPIAGAALPKLKIGRVPLGQGQHLIVAGYPSGVPEKVAGGATVIDSRAASKDFFLSDLDSFPGNSGGGVFVEETGELAGVLVRGPNPGYVVAAGEACARPEHSPNGTGSLIESTYVHHAIEALCATLPDARLCACGDGACKLEQGETTATCPSDCGTRCNDGACNGSETGDNCYSDCGACGNGSCEQDEVLRMNCPADCGCSPGLAPNKGVCVSVRGNVNGDDRIDRDDVSALTQAIDQRGGMQVHRAAADVDCNGVVDARDLRGLADFVRGRTPHLPCETIRAVSTGVGHSCALGLTGKIRCWGDDTFGQLGVGRPQAPGVVQSAGALPLVDLASPATSVSAGATHTCALLDGGRVSCWGDESDGKLGYGRVLPVGAVASPSAARAVSIGSLATAVVAGGTHTCAILDRGTVRCWGNNDFGQLGYGTPGAVGDDEAPSSVGALQFAEPVIQLALGVDHTCALTSAGNVYCWGENFLGQLGRGTFEGGGPFERADTLEPVALGGPVRSISAGFLTTCAIRVDGNAFCWGDNAFGQLGYPHTDTIGDDERPVDAGPLSVGPRLQKLVLGQGLTCGLYSGGAVKCWGFNGTGQLGYGNTDPLPEGATPETLAPVPVGQPSLDLALGSGHVCSVVSGGSVRCWGSDSNGQLGYGDTLPVGDASTPASVGDVPMAPKPTPGWEFRNDRHLSVWLSHDDERRLGGGTELSLRVSNDGDAEPLASARAWYDFAAGPGEPESVALDASPGNRSPVTLESTSGGHFSALFSLERSASCSGTSAFAPLHIRLRPSAASSGRWNWENDYSALDRPSRSGWYRTQRIQLLDPAGHIVFGWAPATSP